ncbi:MAG: hypothetical protein WBF17_12190 [Phycisphaerae bacterium]
MRKPPHRKLNSAAGANQKHKARARKRSATITLAWSKDHLRVIGKIERVVRD